MNSNPANSLTTHPRDRISTMPLQLRVFFIVLQTYCLLILKTTAIKNEQQLSKMPLIQGIPIISSQARAARIAEFISSHKIMHDIHEKDTRPLHYDSSKDEQEKQQKIIINHKNESSGLRFKDKMSTTRKLNDRVHYTINNQDLLEKDKTLSEVFSSGNPTTILPILTTQKDNRLFDFVPVNIIREDSKGNPFAAFDTKNLEDIGDVNLVPAGSNTRIQVKKGPNGKDYEYEYVYYYYDEEDESKGGTTIDNSEKSTKTSIPISNSGTSSRRNNSNRNKYSNFDRSTTIEPVVNEVIPSGNESRMRYLDNIHEDVSEERLPTNTRFPPRSRANQPLDANDRVNRVRGNRQKANVDSVDTSKFRGPQEGSEFPQNLSNGPLRFLGVTPYEASEEKTTTRGSFKSQKIQEPAPVHESYQEMNYARKRPGVEQYDVLPEQQKVQSQSGQHSYLNGENDFHEPIVSIPKNPSFTNFQEEREFYTDITTDITDSPTTVAPQIMDKVALDLYAFLQQGRNNFVDFIKDSEYNGLTTESSPDFEESTLSDAEFEDSISTISPSTTIPSTITTSTTVTTTFSTTTSAPLSSSEDSISRGKFRRPGLGNLGISRNRFKSNNILSDFNNTDTKPTENSLGNNSNQKTRGRFGQISGNSGFKRIRPLGSKQSPHAHVNVPVNEKGQKENVQKINVEVTPVTGRSRFRGGAARSSPQTKTTVATSTRDKLIATTGNPFSVISPAVHRSGGFNKLNAIGRRRGNRPLGEQSNLSIEQSTVMINSTQENDSDEPQRSVPKLSIIGTRSKLLNKPLIKPGAGRLNLRLKIGQSTTTSTTEPVPGETTVTVLSVEGTIDEPASEATEEETREAPANSGSALRSSSVNPLNKLRNRNKIQIQHKTTTKSLVPPVIRRSPLISRRKTTEIPFQLMESLIDVQSDPSLSFDEPELMESPHLITEVKSSINTKNEESIKGLSSLLANRRRITSKI